MENFMDTMTIETISNEVDSWLEGIGVDVSGIMQSLQVSVSNGVETVEEVANGACSLAEDVYAGLDDGGFDSENDGTQEKDDTTDESKPSADCATEGSGTASPTEPEETPNPLESEPTATSGSEAGSEDTSTNQTNRPSRPSSASAQMAALLSAAKAQAGNSKPAGKCYRAFKQHVLAAGGYGDILDIYKDERFKEYQLAAINFADAVNANGLANLGLEEVSGSNPIGATPGTVLVLKGNGKMKMSVTYGDISVVDKIEGGVLICYNDGLMKLSAKAETWAAGGEYEGCMIGMYRPISRS